MKYKIEGLEFSKPNKNGRIYERQSVENAFENASKPIFVQVDVPEDSTVHMDKICAKIINWEIDDEGVTADVEILNTPMGEIIQALLDTKINLEMVSCGFGKLTTDENGIHVVSDYQLTSLAFVPPAKKK